MAPSPPPSPPAQPPSTPPPGRPGPRRSLAQVAIRSARFVASALLLLGAGLEAHGLFLPWWHYTQPDGSPFSKPSDTQMVIPAVTFGLEDSRVQVLLGCAGAAVVVGLVSLVLPKRTLGWLALVAAAVGLAGLALAYLIGTVGSIVDADVRTVYDGGYYLYGLGCVLILAGAWALVTVRRSRVPPT